MPAQQFLVSAPSVSASNASPTEHHRWYERWCSLPANLRYDLPGCCCHVEPRNGFRRVCKRRVFRDRRSHEVGQQKGVNSLPIRCRPKVYPRHRVEIRNGRERKCFRKLRRIVSSPVIAKLTLTRHADLGSHESARQHKCQQSFHHVFLRKLQSGSSPWPGTSPNIGRRTLNEKKGSFPGSLVAPIPSPSRCVTNSALLARKADLTDSPYTECF